MGNESAAPTDARTTADVIPALRLAGITAPAAPAASAVRKIASGW